MCSAYFHKADKIQNHLGSVHHGNKPPNHWDEAGADVIFQQMCHLLFKELITLDRGGKMARVGENHKGEGMSVKS